MSAHADEIRDAEILDLQRQVKALKDRVTELERRPVYVPYHVTPPPAAAPVSPQWPHYPALPWTSKTYWTV